jgi:hypothetical protein
VATFGSNPLLLTGSLQINKPSIYQQLMVPNQELGNMCSLIVMTVAFAILLTMMPKLKDDMLRVNLYRHIALIGIIIIAYSFFERYQYRVATAIIKANTEGQFEFDKPDHVFVPVVWVGILISMIGRIYNKAFTLKQEQDLTI